MTLTMHPELIQEKDRCRFARFVPVADDGDCWEWQSTRNRNGYGKFWLDGRTDLAHRVSYRIAKGAIPQGMQIRHTCDNPPCVNPKHLLIGTGKQNARDALDRGRYRQGAGNGRARLTSQQVLDIRRRLSEGEMQVALAREYGVCKSTVQWIASGRNWKCLEVAK